MDERREPLTPEGEPHHAQEAESIPDEALTHADQDDRGHPQRPEHAQEADTIPAHPLRHAQRDKR
jgi:hypothetical protein